MRSRFTIRKLGNSIREISMRNNKNLIKEVYSVTNSDGFIKSTDYFDKEVFSKNISNYKIVRPMQFAYNPSRVNVGSIAFLQEKFDVVISPLYIVFKCEDNLLPDYLLRYLKSRTGLTQIRSKTRGAVRDSLSFNNLADIDIPLPSVNEQAKIVELLMRTDSLLEKRRKTIQLLDQLETDLFQDFFGNPVRNEKDWKVGEFDTYLHDIVAGSSAGGEEKEELAPGEVGILKVSAVTKGRFNPREFKVVRPENLGNRLVSPKRGDLLFSRANTRELVGATCIVDADYPNLYLPDKLWSLIVDESLFSNIYLHFLFQNIYFRNKLTQTATGSSASMLNISMEKLREASIPIPPKALQDQFANLYYEIESVRTRCMESLTTLEKFANSLSYNAFRGELNLQKMTTVLEAPVMAEIVEPPVQASIPPAGKEEKKTVPAGNIVKTIANRHFQSRTFSFEQLAGKIQESLEQEEFDYEKVKKQIFDCIQGKGDIKLEQLFIENERRLLLRVVK